MGGSPPSSPVSELTGEKSQGAVSKFQQGEWVQHSRLGVRGVVKGHRGRSALVRWVGRTKATSHGDAAARPAIGEVRMTRKSEGA
jgi:hypothetical protein